MKIGHGKIIDKKFILDHVQESAIFERYLGIPVVLDKDYRNPLRSDNNPGCRFYIHKSTGRLKFNDFGKQVYDCFDVVQTRYNLSFGEAIKKIAFDFNLTDKSPTVNQDHLAGYSSLEGDENAMPIIKVATRDFTTQELRYWAQYGISKKRLKKFNVFGLAKATYTRGTYTKVVFIHKGRENAFCYYIDGEWKLYFPDRKTERFFQVSQMAVQGYEHLPKTGRSVVITKSYKDVMGFDIFGIPAIAPQSENVQLSKLLIKELQDRFENVYILYDNDWAGKRAMVKRFHEYPDLIPLLFAKGKPKDLTDNIKQFGIGYVGEIVNNSIEK